jgi:hypothetical protein
MRTKLSISQLEETTEQSCNRSHYALSIIQIGQEQLKLCGSQATRTKRSFCLRRPPRFARSTHQTSWWPCCKYTWLSRTFGSAVLHGYLCLHCTLLQGTGQQTGTINLLRILPWQAINMIGYGGRLPLSTTWLAHRVRGTSDYIRSPLPLDKKKQIHQP